jgi:hypothetical protein
MALSKRRRPPVPLDEQMLGELALLFVGRFGTSLGKPRSHLPR